MSSAALVPIKTRKGVCYVSPNHIVAVVPVQDEPVVSRNEPFTRIIYNSLRKIDLPCDLAAATTALEPWLTGRATEGTDHA